MTAAEAKATKGAATRERILEVAERLVLKQGYTGTSIDDILRHAHITKGGFFYHFSGKNDLAIGLMQRYQRNDHAFFMDLATRARELVEDPLHQLLLFLKLMSDEMANLPEVHPGCLVATFVYESEQVDDRVREINVGVLQAWRNLFSEQIANVDTRYEKCLDVDNDALADMLTSVIEGGIIISKALSERRILADQILQYRNYIRLLYGIA
ncbi:MAG: TetR/AcrR family transcriptional regulator [Pseudomonadales bacterium]|nr:TetR/AcrR family transcriptional regulator [Pseudomonadales bacterium]